MKHVYPTLLAATVLLVGAPRNALAQEAAFEGLGRIPGSLHVSEALAVSADGSVVVGRDQMPGGYEAFRWENGAMEGLGEPEFDPFPRVANGVSADGALVVGSGSGGAFRWEDGEVERLSDPDDNFQAIAAYAVSADGSVIVGDGSLEDGTEAFRWEDGEMEGLGFLPDGDVSYSWAFAVSADGAVVVGASSSANSNFWEAFRWEGGEMEGLGALTGGNSSQADGVSADGSVIVGWSGSEDGVQAFRWEDGEMEGLGDVLFGSSPDVSISADGSVIVWQRWTQNGREIVYWTEDDGARNLEEMLEGEYGLDLSGWALQDATGVSVDGSVIVGWGYNPEGLTEAWRAFLGKPIADEATPGELVEMLSSPSPNPASEVVTLTIAVERSQDVRVEVFDVMGRRVQTLYSGPFASGMRERLSLDVSTLPAGVYIIRATGEDFVRTRRVTVMR